jgi:hypothetical protein
LIDSAPAVDIAAYSLATVRVDSVSGEDYSSRTPDKRAVDSFGTSDILARAISRYLADAFALNDSTGIGDGIAYQTIKTIRNVTTATDVKSYALSKNFLVDTSAMLDAGVLAIQGYCDWTYFSADYVGESRQF